MGLLPEPINARFFRAKIISVDGENRTVDVKVLNDETKYTKVMVLSEAGNYSMPRTGDIGLIIGDVTSMYWLGRLDFGYKKKLDDKLAGKKDPNTGKKWTGVLIDEGVTYITNLLQNINLNLSNSGDFSLTNALQEGIMYVRNKSGKPLRWLQLLGRSISIYGANVSMNIGTVVRSIPPFGYSTVNDETGTAPAKEIYGQVTNTVGVVPLAMAKIKLGNVLQDPVTNAQVGVPELGAFGGFLRVLLGAHNAAGLPAGALKIDQSGNIDIVSLFGQLLLNGITIHIGGLPSTHPAVFGDQLLIWLNAHTHPTSVGPSGPPVTPATTADFCSTKVLLS